MLAIYVIAMIATTWHFAYGIWLFSVKWGITPGDRARKRFGYVCAAIGTALCLMGLISIYAVVYKYPNAPADVMPAQPAGHRPPRHHSPTVSWHKLNVHATFMQVFSYFLWICLVFGTYSYKRSDVRTAAVGICANGIFAVCDEDSDTSAKAKTVRH